MKAELAKMNKYNVWTVINQDSVPNIRTVGAKWVHTRKIDKPAKRQDTALDGWPKATVK